MGPSTLIPSKKFENATRGDVALVLSQRGATINSKVDPNHIIARAKSANDVVRALSVFPVSSCDFKFLFSCLPWHPQSTVHYMINSNRKISIYKYLRFAPSRAGTPSLRFAFSNSIEGNEETFFYGAIDCDIEEFRFFMEPFTLLLRSQLFYAAIYFATEESTCL